MANANRGFGQAGQFAGAERRFRVLMQHAADGICLLDARRTILYTTPPLERMLESAPEELAGVDALTLLHPDDRERGARFFEALLNGAAAASLDCRLRRKDAGWTAAEAEGANLLTDPAVNALLVNFRAGRAREGHARLRALFETAAQGIVTVDAEGRMTEVNSRLEELFGYTRSELVGQPLEILIPDRLREAHATHIRRYFASPHTRPMGAPVEMAGRRKDGSEFAIEIGLSYECGEGAPCAMAFVNDITERKRAEETVRESQKFETLGVLAGGIAHDFNNLLVGIMGNASLLQERLTETAEQDAAAEIIIASERAAELTRQLLAYAGKGRFQMCAVDISAAVREIARLVRTSIPTAVRLDLRLADDLPPICADPSQIQQVAASLIMNGAEAIPPDRPGTVTVSTSLRVQPREDGPAALRFVCLEVRDDGCGMDQKMQARIFDPFFTTKFQGRGLGLSAVQGIVRSHRGVLRVSSREGRGSTFEVLFPAP